MHDTHRRHPGVAGRILLAAVPLLVTAACSTAAAPTAESQPVTPTPGHPVRSTAQVRSPAAKTGPTTKEPDPVSTISIRVADQTLTGELHDNPTAQDLADQLPLTLTFDDFNQVEKVAKLPRTLTMDGVPAGDDPEINDIGYYAPSRSLVFYYGDVGYWNGIVRIGRLSDDAIDLLQRQPDGFSVTINQAP